MSLIFKQVLLFRKRLFHIACYFHSKHSKWISTDYNNLGTYSSKTQIFAVINSLIYLRQKSRKLWNIFLPNICTELCSGEECQEYGWINLETLLYGPCRRVRLHWHMRRRMAFYTHRSLPNLRRFILKSKLEYFFLVPIKNSQFCNLYLPE